MVIVKGVILIKERIVSSKSRDSWLLKNFIIFGLLVDRDSNFLFDINNNIIKVLNLNFNLILTF